VNIRPAEGADHAAIRAVVAAAFGRADEADIVEAVRAGGQALCEFVADDQGRVIGHVLFNHMACEPPSLVAGLAPLAVAPASQSLGVGAALVRRGLDVCRQSGVRGCVVLGSPAYYGRFGFRRAPATIVCRFQALEAFQALAFDDDVFMSPIALAYPPAFD
jgi:putative acetyltransferase